MGSDGWNLLSWTSHLLTKQRLWAGPFPNFSFAVMASAPRVRAEILCADAPSWILSSVWSAEQSQGARSSPQALRSVTPKLTHWVRLNELYWNNKCCAQHTGVWMRDLSGRQGLGMALWCSTCWSLGGDLRGRGRTLCSAVHGACSGCILGNWTLSLSFARSFCLFVWHAHAFILFDCAFWGILSSALRADSCAQGWLLARTCNPGDLNSGHSLARQVPKPFHILPVQSWYFHPIYVGHPAELLVISSRVNCNLVPLELSLLPSWIAHTEFHLLVVPVCTDFTRLLNNCAVIFICIRICLLTVL